MKQLTIDSVSLINSMSMESAVRYYNACRIAADKTLAILRLAELQISAELKQSSQIPTSISAASGIEQWMQLESSSVAAARDCHDLALSNLHIALINLEKTQAKVRTFGSLIKKQEYLDSMMKINRMQAELNEILLITKADRGERTI